MRADRVALIVLGLALAVGCGQTPKPPQTAEQLKGRLDAANQMADISKRADALKVIAVDAADAGSVDLVLKSIGGIPNLGTKNEVAEACALKLMKRGDTNAATTIAGTIVNLQKRNEILGRIAKGS